MPQAFSLAGTRPCRRRSPRTQSSLTGSASLAGPAPASMPQALPGTGVARLAHVADTASAATVQAAPITQALPAPRAATTTAGRAGDGLAVRVCSAGAASHDHAKKPCRHKRPHRHLWHRPRKQRRPCGPVASQGNAGPRGHAASPATHRRSRPGFSIGSRLSACTNKCGTAPH